MLEIKDLHVQFHTSDHEAVRGISLRVDDGEIMGLVGESGSGKSVTAMMIAGLLREDRVRTEGQILLDGRDMLAVDGDDLLSYQGKEIGVVTIGLNDGVYRARVENVTGRHAIYLRAEMNQPKSDWMMPFFDGRVICDVEEFVFLK